MRIILAILLMASPVFGQNWTENNGKREWAQAERTKVMVSHEFEMISWPGLPDSTYFKIDLGGLPGDFTWVADTTIVRLDTYFDARFYDSNGGLEWEAILYQKPGNQFSWTFPIEYNNLEFLYQPLVLPDDPNAIVLDYPDSVAGSYAVYHSGKRWNEYKAGKAFHIYRPKAWDSAGDTVWLDLDIDTVANEITIAGTRQWFRNAVYPVTIDPYFGYQSDGSTSIGLPNWPAARGNRYDTDQYTASAGDVVDSIYFYAGDNNDDAYFGVYTTSTDVPNIRLDTIGSVSLPPTDAWNVIACNISLSDGVEYTLVFRADQDISTYADVLSNGISGDNGSGLPATWSEDFTQNYRLSLYAKYTAGGAAPTGNRRLILLRSD